MVYEYITKNYEAGEPIFLNDIKIKGISNDNLRYHFKKLTDDGLIKRFDSGVYYIPEKSDFGDIKLSADEVVYNKYINKKNNNIGFYSGGTLANRMHLSSQVPFKKEIVSNNAPAKVREIKVKNQKYVVRKAIVEITNENYKVLQLLECLKDVDSTADEDEETIKEILTEYILHNKISKEMVDKYIGYYPLKTYKALYETGVSNVLTSK